MPHPKIQQRLLLTSIIMFGILLLIVILSLAIIQRKSRIQAALNQSEQSREQLRLAEGVNESLLNVELSFKKYCTTFDPEHFAEYRSEVDSLSQKIDRLLRAGQDGHETGGENISSILNDKEQEAAVYARLKQLNDSLIFSVADLSSKQEQISVQLNRPIQATVDTLRSVESSERHRKGLLGKLKTAIVGETQTEQVKTTLVVSSQPGAGSEIGKPAPIEFQTADGKVSAQELAEVGAKLASSERKLILLNGNLIAEIKPMVAEIRGATRQRSERRNETFISSINNSAQLLPGMLMFLVATGACLVAYILVLSFRNEENQKQIIALNAKIQDDLTEKDKFLSIIGHDLKNPFNALLGFSDILKETANSGSRDDIREYSEVVHSSAKRVFNLVHNLLVWSRMNNGRIGFSPTPVLLSKLVDDNMEVMLPIAQNKDIDLSWQVDEGICVQLDKNMIGSVLQNLVTNAIKFTPRGGQVILYAGLDSGQIEVVVTDNGVGMSPEQQSKVFNLAKDYRTHGTNQEEGTGLGLVISKEFIEAHHGRIGVESSQGNGSRFWFQIPLVLPDEMKLDVSA